MANSIKLCFTLSLLVALFPFGHPQVDYHVVCQRTTVTNLCNSVIEGDDGRGSKTTPIGHLTILSEKARDFSFVAQERIRQLLMPFIEGKANDTHLKYCLQLCADQYTRVSYALHWFYWPEFDPKSNYPDYMAKLGEALDGVNTCMNVFTQFPPIPTPSPLNAYQVDIKMLIELTLQVLNLNTCGRITACRLQ